jgi:hypothetical protein
MITKDKNLPKDRIKYLKRLIKEAKEEQKLSHSDIYSNWVKDAYKEIEELKSKEKK